MTRSKTGETGASVAGSLRRVGWLVGLLACWFVASCSARTLYAQDAESSIDERLTQALLSTAGSPSPAPLAALERPEVWDRFLVFVWQFQNDVERDWNLYQQVNLRAAHLDYGRGQQPRVSWLRNRGVPYYQDHAAGKGVLHLTDRMGLGELRQDGTLQTRPQSLVMRGSLDRLRAEITANVSVAATGPVAAIALDDEVSLANFNSPYEVDASAPSVQLFRRWLAARYGQIARLNRQWQTGYESFDEVMPCSFEQVRPSLVGTPFAGWNLSPWVDWRSYMDSQFAAAIGVLSEHAGALAPQIPVGIVGGQAPSAYGGFDYAKLRDRVQWMEAYDIGGTNELLGSFWANSRRPVVQTFFVTGDAQRDAWFLWYYWAHGNAAVIAWPDTGKGPWFETDPGGARRVRPEIEALADTFEELQGDTLAPLTSRDARQKRDPVALLYSHTSVQASWATDALTHGRTWPRRSSSLDNKCSSSGKNRVAWNKLLEDCGVQGRWVTETDVVAGMLEREEIRVLILPRAMSLAESTCEAIRSFAERGGVVVGDYWTGILDAHGRGRIAEERLVGGLDDLFGLQRDETRGYFDGRTVTEIDGEKYQRPFLERLAGDVVLDGEPAEIERGTRVTKQSDAVYLNRSPVPYVDPSYRDAAAGQWWRDRVTEILSEAGVKPAIRVTLNGRVVPGIEVLRWRVGEEDWVIVIANPTREAAIDGAGASSSLGISGTLALEFRQPHAGATNVRTGQAFSAGNRIDGIAFDVGSAVALRMQAR